MSVATFHGKQESRQGGLLWQLVSKNFEWDLSRDFQGDDKRMDESLFDQLGGAAAVDAAVDRFYPKVLSDDRISHFFEGVDMLRQASKQKAFLTLAFGGPKKYSGRAMRAGHADLVKRGLSDEHFDAVVENLATTLKEMGVEEELIKRVAEVAESTRKDVLGR